MYIPRNDECIHTTKMLYTSCIMFHPICFFFFMATLVLVHQQGSPETLPTEASQRAAQRSQTQGVSVSSIHGHTDGIGSNSQRCFIYKHWHGQIFQKKIIPAVSYSYASLWYVQNGTNSLNMVAFWETLVWRCFLNGELMKTHQPEMRDSTTSQPIVSCRFSKTVRVDNIGAYRVFLCVCSSVMDISCVFLIDYAVYISIWMYTYHKSYTFFVQPGTTWSHTDFATYFQVFWGLIRHDYILQHYSSSSPLKCICRNEEAGITKKCQMAQHIPRSEGRSPDDDYINLQYAYFIVKLKFVIHASCSMRLTPTMPCFFVSRLRWQKPKLPRSRCRNPWCWHHKGRRQTFVVFVSNHWIISYQPSKPLFLVKVRVEFSYCQSLDVPASHGEIIV